MTRRRRLAAPAGGAGITDIRQLSDSLIGGICAFHLIPPVMVTSGVTVSDVLITNSFPVVPWHGSLMLYVIALFWVSGPLTGLILSPFGG